MNLQGFVEKFADILDISAISISGNTEFKLLEQWSSLTSLAIIAMIDEEYDVVIKGKDIRETETIEDLFNVIKANK